MAVAHHGGLPSAVRSPRLHDTVGPRWGIRVVLDRTVGLPCTVPTVRTEQLGRHLVEHVPAPVLGAEAAVPVSPAQCFELVVQVFHGAISYGEFS